MVDGMNCRKVTELIKLAGRIFDISRNTIAINNKKIIDTIILIFLKYSSFNISHYFSVDRKLI